MATFYYFSSFFYQIPGSLQVSSMFGARWRMFEASKQSYKTQVEHICLDEIKQS